MPRRLRFASGVERNALRANLVECAEQWRWSSLWWRAQGGTPLLDAGPVEGPRDWRQRVQLRETEAELAALRRSVVRGTPFGESSWQERTAARLGLQSTLRPRGRPRNLATEEIDPFVPPFVPFVRPLSSTPLSFHPSKARMGSH